MIKNYRCDAKKALSKEEMSNLRGIYALVILIVDIIYSIFNNFYSVFVNIPVNLYSLSS